MKVAKPRRAGRGRRPTKQVVKPITPPTKHLLDSSPSPPIPPPMRGLRIALGARLYTPPQSPIPQKHYPPRVALAFSIAE